MSISSAGMPTRAKRPSPSGSTAYVYRWDRQGRKGQTCRLLARGKMNSCCVEFEDGYRMITSRNAIKRAR